LVTFSRTGSGEGYLRFSYAASMDKIKEGLDCIKKFLKERQSKA